MTSVVTSPSGARFTLFFSIRSPFSNFHPCTFTIADQTNDGSANTKTFFCTEQYYMYHKALSSGDVETANEVMKEREARKIKMLGKNVKNFDRSKWETLCDDVMWRCNVAKYSQNDDLRNKLFCTHGSILVECSPSDPVWGIGMDIHEPDAVEPSKWRGKNKLGHLLTSVREHMWKQIEFAHDVAKALTVVDNLDEHIHKLFLPPKPKFSANPMFHSTPNSTSTWNNKANYLNRTWHGTSAITPLKRPASPAMLQHPETKRLRMDGDSPISTSTNFSPQNGASASTTGMNSMPRYQGWNREDQTPVRSEEKLESRGTKDSTDRGATTLERKISSSYRRSLTASRSQAAHIAEHSRRHSSRKRSAKRGRRWTSSSSSETSRSRSRSRHRRHRKTHKRQSKRNRRRSYSDSEDEPRSKKVSRRKRSTVDDSDSDTDRRRSSKKKNKSTRNGIESNETARGSDSERETIETKWREEEEETTPLFTSLLQKLKRKPSGLWQKTDKNFEGESVNGNGVSMPAGLNQTP